jgi:hypothetical protein
MQQNKFVRASAALACALALGLAGCGGGSDSVASGAGATTDTGAGTDAGTSADTATYGAGPGGISTGIGGATPGSATRAAGVWCGAGADASTVKFVVLDDGTVWGLAEDNASCGGMTFNNYVNNGSSFFGVFTATASVLSGSVTDVDAVDGTQQVISFTGQAAPKQSLTGSMRTAAGSQDFDFTYVAGWDTPLPMSAFAGSYAITGRVPGGLAPSGMRMNIDVDGTIALTSGNGSCQATGTSLARTDVAVLDMALRFVSACGSAPSGTTMRVLAGWDFTDEAGPQLIMGGPSATPGRGVVLSGTPD